MKENFFYRRKHEIDSLVRQGRLLEARQRIKDVCAQQKDSAEAWCLYGTVLGRSGDNAAAIDCFRKAIVLDPRFVQAYNNLGIVHAIQNELEKAETYVLEGLRLNPDYAPGYYNLAKIQEQVGSVKEAEQSYRQAILLQHDYVAAYANLAILLRQQQRLSEAIALYQIILKQIPGDSRIYTNLGNVYRDQGNLERAVECYRKSIENQRDYIDAYINLAVTYAEQGQRKRARDIYAKATEIDSECSAAWAGLFHQAQYLCDWRTTAYAKPYLDVLTKKELNAGHTPGETPFISVAREEQPSINKAIAVAWSRRIGRQANRNSMRYQFANHDNSQAPIRLAYLSNDLHDHATTHLILGLLRKHNREKFKIYAYSYGPDDGSDYRKNLIAACDHFHDIRYLTDKEAADRIYQDRVDILIDLKGYTAGARLGICALRPAPVQITYLGFPGTLGADFFNYLVCDKFVIPEDHRMYYTEKLIYMPDCYQANDNSQTIAERRFTRQDCGLPEKGFVFCSFNQTFKIDPPIFDVWMDILRQIEGSVLWLFRSNPVAEDNLRKEAENRGVASKRIIYGAKLAKPYHLARLTVADLALDTKIYNGHTTTSDALWAGVPVVTVEGRHFASRVSASILRAGGMGELVTGNVTEYRSLAIYLARNTHLLQAIKKRLLINRTTCALFDTGLFVKNFEEGMERIFSGYCNGLDLGDLVI